MFEKEAEKIVNKELCSDMMCYGHCNFSNPKHHRCGDWHRCYKIAKVGAELGYNKAKKEIEAELLKCYQGYPEQVEITKGVSN